MSEPTLTDIAQQLSEVKTDLSSFRAETAQEFEKINKRLDTLDNRFFEFSMRIVSANSSAFWGVGIALLSAAIAFVVARVSGGNL